jgi:hypothetical protein
VLARSTTGVETKVPIVQVGGGMRIYLGKAFEGFFVSAETMWNLATLDPGQWLAHNELKPRAVLIPAIGYKASEAGLTLDFRAGFGIKLKGSSTPFPGDDLTTALDFGLGWTF